jgi:hypothetical protein
MEKNIKCFIDILKWQLFWEKKWWRDNYCETEGVIIITQLEFTHLFNKKLLSCSKNKVIECMNFLW